MQEYQYIIPDFLNGQRVDKALAKLCTECTRTQIQKAIKNQKARLNGNVISNQNTKVNVDDKVIINIEEEEISESLVPYNTPLDILYEDEDVIVINKSKDMTVHPGAGNHKETMVNALIYHGKNLSQMEGAEFRPGIVHRLDKNTSGLMVVAKNNNAHVSLAKQIEDRELIRKYKALIWGMLNPLKGSIDINISRNRSDRTKMTTVKSGGKKAITHYKTINVFAKNLFSLIECQLETGRTHQIRVHLSHIGHSIIGDQKYGNNNRKTSSLKNDHYRDLIRSIDSQALHSYYISFIHPKSNQRMEFQTDLPTDLEKIIENFSTLDIKNKK